MVAKTPLKEKRLAMALNPNLVRETVKKVDRCMARLQELQYTITGGTKAISGVNLSPRSTRGYLKTSLRCKQESLRMNAAARKSLPGSGEWRRMSLPAMLLGETVVEILQASKFAKDIILPKPKPISDPKTPIANKKKVHCESTELRTRRIKEKQTLRLTGHSEANSPPKLRTARTRIAFKSNSPLKKRDNETRHVAASRISPKNRPWAKKTVMFPNPVFLNSSTSPKFYKTRSPVIIGRSAAKPHKFLVKSPSSKSQFKNKKAVLPSPIVLNPAEKKARRFSFSPSKLATRLVSPLKNRISFRRSSGVGLMSGLKQRPNFGTPVKTSCCTKRRM